MPGPLIAVDAPSLLYRAFHALPRSITGAGRPPVNALLGMANLVLQAVERHEPRAVVLCFGAEAATYRVEAYAGYHADRPPVPDELAPQWADAPAFFGAFGWTSLVETQLEADDLLGSLAAVETDAGGRALLFTGDRDMFQCVGERVAVLFPARQGRAGGHRPDEVRARYGVAPDQVPDFIALRGDPSDGLPGAKGIGEKTARDLLRDHETLEALIAAAGSPRADLRPRQRAALTDDADAIRAFRDIATLRARRPRAPARRPDDVGARRGARARARDEQARRAPRPRTRA